MTITLTTQAIDKVKTLMSLDNSPQKKAFRISLRPGGCSGFEYEFAFDHPQEGDAVIDQGSIRVAVDSASIDRLANTVIDYTQDLLAGSKFVVQNPNAKGTCGCGTSVTF